MDLIVNIALKMAKTSNKMVFFCCLIRKNSIFRRKFRITAWITPPPTPAGDGRSFRYGSYPHPPALGAGLLGTAAGRSVMTASPQAVS